MTDITTRRLRAQRLTGARFSSAVEAVRWFGAVQAQDYAAAKWALGQRVEGATEGALDHLFDEGVLLRTHVLRPTWHFVLPEDIRWMLKLTGPRILRGLAGRLGRLEIDDRQLLRAEELFGAALQGGSYLTRAELAMVLERAGISPDGQRLPHLLMVAELKGLIASGPRRGKQFTWGLLDERAPDGRGPEGEDAVTALAERYFVSHGPAQLADFAWWSGLTVTEARAAVRRLGSRLEHMAVDGQEYWLDPALDRRPLHDMTAHLLPNFDEFTVAYRDRAAALDPGRPLDPSLFSFGSVLSNIVTIGGRVRGAWRRTAVRGGLRVELRLMGELEARERTALEAACGQMSVFLGEPVRLAWP